MEITVKIDQRNKEAKALVAYLRNLSFVTVSKENKDANHSTNNELTEQQLAWVSRLKKVKKEIDNGTFKGNPINKLMDEL